MLENKHIIAVIIVLLVVLVFWYMQKSESYCPGWAARSGACDKDGWGFMKKVHEMRGHAMAWGKGGKPKKDEAVPEGDAAQTTQAEATQNTSQKEGCCGVRGRAGCGPCGTRSCVGGVCTL